jgi:hypothetical protein
MAHATQPQPPTQQAAPSGENLAKTGPPQSHHVAPRRDRLAQTGPLFAVLFPMLLVYGLAVLTGATASTGALVAALVLLVLVTYGVVMGTVHMINLPPENGDDEQGQHPTHG